MSKLVAFFTYPEPEREDAATKLMARAAFVGVAAMVAAIVGTLATLIG